MLTLIAAFAVSVPDARASYDDDDDATEVQERGS
jgi:hypothetical protein